MRRARWLGGEKRRGGGGFFPCADAQGTVASGVWVSLLWGLGFLAVEVAGASVKKIFFGMW